jgi:Fe-S-cluster containining protein
MFALVRPADVGSRRSGSTSRGRKSVGSRPLPDDDAVPVCLSCGVCCFSRMPMYVRVTGDDYERLGDRAAELVWFDNNRAYMRMLDGRCAALHVDENARRFVCTAYDVRPTTCRELARGSPQCLGERASKAERPGQALDRISRLDLGDNHTQIRRRRSAALAVAPSIKGPWSTARSPAAKLGTVAARFDLARFHHAQNETHDGFAAALRQLGAGRKTSHWVWYVFPQLRGCSARLRWRSATGWTGPARAWLT